MGRQGAPPLAHHRATPPSGGAALSLLPQIKMYAGLQSVWWAGTYMICYRYQPTVLIMRTGWGSRAVHWVGGWLKRVGAWRA